MTSSTSEIEPNVVARLSEAPSLIQQLEGLGVTVGGALRRVTHVERIVQIQKWIVLSIPVSSDSNTLRGVFQYHIARAKLRSCLSRAKGGITWPKGRITVLRAGAKGRKSGAVN